VSIRILRLSRPAELLESLAERRDKGLSFQVALGACHQHINPPHPLRLLRARGEGPRRRACERRDELAPPQIIGPHSSPPVRGPRRILPKMAYRGQGAVAYFAVQRKTQECRVLAHRVSG